jgi:hypothetical protein
VPVNDKPLEVLRRRPDVIAAERRLAASNARIGQALADFYPKISLAGLLGYESSHPSDLFKAATFQPQGLAGLRWRVFDFGKVSAEVAQAKGAEAEALASYQHTVLRATEEIENAFTSLVQVEAHQQELTTEVAALKRARDASQEAYQGGVSSGISGAHPEPKVSAPTCLPLEYAIDVRTPAAYKQPVVLIETSVFTRLVIKTLSDEDYGTLQQWLVDNPDAGDLVRGGGGM